MSIPRNLSKLAVGADSSGILGIDKGGTGGTTTLQALTNLGAYPASNPNNYITSTTAASTYQILDADLTAIAGLSGTSGLLKKTAANTWSLDTSVYITGITSTDVTTALGFTPYNATNPSGYISSITSSNVTTALGFTPYNATNPSGYISSITSSNVTTALGFTPYNATNPNGYISSITSGNVTTALGFTPENAANKGVANGYASLDSSGLVPSTQLPSYVDDVLEYTNLASFPATGATGKIFVAIDTGKTYRWSGSAYVEISASPGSTDAVTEGTTNLYYTNTRARAALSASQNLTYNSSTGAFTGPDLSTYLNTTNTLTVTNKTFSTGSVWNGGTIGIAYGGTGATTAQTAMNTFAGAVTSGSYLRGNGTNVVMSAIQVGDVPTLNQNTTGTAANVTGVVAAANGGTGQSSYTVGDIVYASTTTALSKLADVATGNVLISGGVGVAPSYGKVGLATHVSGNLPVTNLNSGTSASSTTFWRGDGTWATPTSSGVTSVAQTFTGGIISVSGSPITTTGTLALTVAGTSGGIPYFSSATGWASSAALASNALVVGGGAGLAPATITTGTGVVTALGVATGSSGAFVVNGGALGTPSSGTVTNLTGTASININGTVGATTKNTGAFTTLSANDTVNLITGQGAAITLSSGSTGNIDNIAIGATYASTGVFTTVTASQVIDGIGDVRTIVQNARTSAYTLTGADPGKHISITTGGVTVPANIFTPGQAVTIFNNSASNQTITQGTNVTMYLAGTATTGNRTLAQRGIATILCITGGATPVFVISGGGLT